MTEKTETMNKDEKGFAAGEHVVLRPVVEADLPDLASLLAESPCDEAPTPWTHQRLKKKFEDKDEPGLWGKSERYFAVVRKAGGVIGFLKENQDENRGMYWNLFHIGEVLEDRDVTGPDALRAYLAYKLKWHNPLRISFDVLEPETDKAAWFTDQNFECELRMERRMLYRGQPTTQCLYTWFGQELIDAPADPQPVPGEE